ncbi:MAG TPA: GrpB family protein [Micromonosporaceae bacterium]|nr:GrpB family protein [Micromonosporaceae bacterium]
MTSPAVVVSPYQMHWPERGAQLALDLSTRLGPLALRVEHIGSTAIPGMAAKPVFDLQVSVRDLDEAAEAFDGPLATFGLTRRPWLHDHVPAGLDDDPKRWSKRVWNNAAEPDRERIILHCRLAGSPNERVALLFRDWLRTKPLAVAAYGRFKRMLAEAVSDRDEYTDVKDPVVDLIIVAAEDWAAATGWTPDQAR